MRVMHAAQHVGHDIALNMAAIAKQRPRVVGMTEMDGPGDPISTAKRVLGPHGYTVCAGDDGGQHCQEVPVAIRLGPLFVLDSVKAIQLSSAVAGDPLAPDRHLQVVRYHHRVTGRKLAHAQTHWNAGLQGPHGNMLHEPRVTAAEHGSEIMEEALRAVLAEGRLLTVAGDFNWRLHTKDPAFGHWTHSPRAMFLRLGLNYTTTGLDWIAWSKGLHQFGGLKIIPVTRAHDHPWSIARLLRVLPTPVPKPKTYPAIVAARKQSHDGPRFGEGECLERVHDCYGIGVRYPSAISAWENAKTKHPTTAVHDIPRGVPIFWRGGSKGFGHVAICAGGGMCWSTDIRRVGYFDYVPITEIHDRWGLTFLGYTRDLNGVAIPA